MQLWRRPKWIVGTALALVAVAVCVSLGLWQLRRLEQRRVANATITQRSALPPAPPGDLAALAGSAGPDQVTFRKAAATGVYVTGEEILLTGRTNQGSPGHHVLTPLVTADGRALLVDRGWVPLSLAVPPIAPAAPPRGEVRVTGRVLADQPQARFGPRIPPTGQLDVVGRVDLPRLQQQVSRPLYPFWVQLEDQQPAQPGAIPVLSPPPELTEGSHLSYAVQWFLFAVVIAVGWPLLLVRTARSPIDKGSPATAPPRERQVPVRTGGSSGKDAP